MADAKASDSSSSRSQSGSPGEHSPSQRYQPRSSSGLRQSELPPSSPELLHDPRDTATERSGLLRSSISYNPPDCGEDDCGHGTFSPRPKYGRGDDSFTETGSRASREEYGTFNGATRPDVIKGSINSDSQHAAQVLHQAVTDGLLDAHDHGSTTHQLAKLHGVRHPRLMYLFYYFPLCNWIRQYRWSYLQGDLIAALTMASFYIPISLSYASNLAHIPPINGLYSFVFNPLVYALLGTCPLMVVGPEAAGSLLTGGVVKEAINGRTHHDHDGSKNAQVAGMVTGLAGAIILAAGLCRLGFLDSVLSRPFLRGFISAIGVVIFFDQLIPEMGLDEAAEHSAAAHGSSLDKIMFLVRHAKDAHRLTCIVSFSTIAIVLLLRFTKMRLQTRYKWVPYIPDRFLVVVLAAIISWQYRWEEKGVAVLGDIKAKGRPFVPEFPFKEHNFKHVNDAFGTGFVIALLGFFESSVAAKSINSSSKSVTRKTIVKDDGSEEEIFEEADGIKGMPVSPNRELVALGVANILGGVFMSLPAFGGYGRSKVNASTGGKTPMSSVFLSLITVICILFLLPYFYYIPKGVLSAMITVVAVSLVEEAPHDIRFFYRISGWSELLLMFLIFVTTFFWNLRIGIAVGIGLSLLRLLKHSARPRIQIMGRIPGTTDFENAEFMPGRVEMVANCLIVKIPEPLTFANTGSLKDRLNRLEAHGTGAAHPALPQVRRSEHNQNIIFDIHGVTGMDPAAAQVLLGIVEDYVNRGTRVTFCRVPSTKSEVWRLMQVSGIVDLCGGNHRFYSSVDAALHATEHSASMALSIDDAEQAIDPRDRLSNTRR